jgi:hypothetical protein
VLSPREVAADTNLVACSMGRGKVLGADMDMVRLERQRTLDRAIGAIRRAIGTDRRSLAEPDDATLRMWLQQLLSRRDQLS